MINEHNTEIETNYKKYYKLVFHTALLILKDISASEDAMQEVFLKYFLNYEKGIENVGAWLVTSTKNHCYNYLRQNKKTVDIEHIPTSTDSPEKLVERKMFFDEVLNNLDSDEKEIFTLHVVCELKHREIADIMSLPQSTVRWKYSNAIKKLRIVLKNY